MVKPYIIVAIILVGILLGFGIKKANFSDTFKYEKTQLVSQATTTIQEEDPYAHGGMWWWMVTTW